MGKGIVVSSCSPTDEVRGSVLRLRELVESLDQTEKWVFSPSIRKTGTAIHEEIHIRYFPLRISDVLTGFKLFLKGWPITNVIFQRGDIRKSQVDAEKIIFHLSRTVQSGDFNPRMTLDLCESLSDNYRLRARLLPVTSVKRLFFLFEARRLEKFEKILSVNEAIHTQFISENDPLLIDAKNYSVMPNTIRAVPRIRSLDAFRAKKIIFVGQLDYEPNLYSIISTSKMLESIDSGYELHIVGSSSKSTGRKLSTLENVVVHGFVDKLDDVIPDSLCGVALIENVTGMQNKVLDYFFFGIPALVSQDVHNGLPKGSPALVVSNRSELREAMEKCQVEMNREKLRAEGYEYLSLISNN